MGFPGGSAVKNLRVMQRREFDPWVRKIFWRRARQPTPVFLPGKSHRQRSLAGYSPWSCKELDTTEATEYAYTYTHTHTHTHTYIHTGMYIMYKIEIIADRGRRRKRDGEKERGSLCGLGPRTPWTGRIAPNSAKGSLTSPVTVSGPSGLLAEYFGCILSQQPLGGCWVCFASVCVY